MNSKLSPRQRQVAVSVCRDRSTKQIAGDLNLSIKSIENHRLEAYKKLDCHTTASLIKKCLQLNIISMEEFLKD